MKARKKIGTKDCPVKNTTSKLWISQNFKGGDCY
jgi:hypothetical protein